MPSSSRAAPQPPVIVAFFDELNTAPESTLALAKEVFLDGTLDGDILPRNIFWTAAINPDSCMQAHRLGYDSAAPPAHAPPGPPATAPQRDPDEVDRADFVVRPLPVSLTHLLLDYRSLTESQERDFLTAYLRGEGCGADDALRVPDAAVAPPTLDAKFAQILRTLILHGQDFIRGARLWRTHVSIRDMLRAVKLYRTLLLPEHRDIFLPDATMTGLDCEAQLRWFACIVAISLSYLFRLPPDLRAAYAQRVDDRIASLGADLRCVQVVSLALDKLFALTSIPEGIARCTALQENLYACVVCLVANVPLNITGACLPRTRAKGSGVVPL